MLRWEEVYQTGLLATEKIVTHGPGVIHTSLEQQNRGAVQKNWEFVRKFEENNLRFMGQPWEILGEFTMNSGI